MHRQSLGSPASKLQSHGAIKADTVNNLISQESSSADAAASEEERKLQKLVIESSTSSSKLIHLIPILTFFCFLVLYLSSHDPSDLGQTQYSGFATRSLKKIGVDENVGGGSMAIRSVWRLEERERRRFNRKFR
ncbi:hypothetical protein HanRHA438_Chr02g0085071 [Helianthus annuus]|nr:hypothetical protein HanHA300_Chr02g0061411 [Helianthus annuus]KAJ0616061.1 hypothetical protein HanIR_Chr02g0086321 [Helianthus annuus]KAJ0619307.1 hypothetical protein HanHA89_Chr02g0069911 [Helianthus annuus]KAJ0940584.1 hypothetical protein HanRHA438_Chr02g0085071 [Helianthus annuus]KAJ0952353.1 hypothetical protein HanPSC8_Chr02g0071271 [Helianthus annuus]